MAEDTKRVLEAELRVAVEAARAGGDAAMAFYGTSRAVEKADDSPVTAADHAANRAILRRLRAAFPDAAILSEESRDDPSRLEHRRVWIVDPLDGTREFLAQNGEFSVMIGLAVDGEAVLGAVYLPDGDRMFSAARGLGAWLEESDGDRAGASRRQLRVGAPDRSSLRLVGSRSHHDPLLERMQAALGITDVEPCGSVGVKCSRIAEGRRDLYVHPVPYLKEWDTCAPEVILREAGGWVGDCAGGPLRYNKPDPRQPDGILAFGGPDPDGVADTVRRIWQEAGSS